MPDADTPFVPGYTLIRQLGAGNFGTVWEARDDAGFPAALKLIDRNGSQASRLELDALQSMTRLRHRHLVRTYTSFDLDAHVVIVMELAEGTLDQRLRHCVEVEQLPGIPVSELLHYTRQIASALDYLHAHKIIHRDIKPDNILLLHDSEPYVALGDCGLLRKQRADDEEATVIGTPAYMSPEVWQHRAGPAGDRYNLAITYVELRQGYRPYTGIDTTSVKRAHREADPDLGGLQEQELEVVRRALAKNPAERHATCQEFVEELERVLGVQPFGFHAVRVGLRAKVPKARPAPPRRAPVDPVAPLGTHRPRVMLPPEQDCPVTVPIPTSTLPAPVTRRSSLLKWVGPCLVALLGAGVIGAILWQVARGRGTVRLGILPAGFRAAEGSERVRVEGHAYPACIVSEKSDEARFWLLTPRTEVHDDPAPFYLLVNKVSNELFRPFAAERPDDAGTSWRQGGRRGDGSDVGSDDAYPVLRVTRPQAGAFARWLGGRLPGFAELDRAAAWRDDRTPDEGPFRGARLGIGRREQGPCALAGPYDEDDCCEETTVRGLAANGAEWTRDDAGGLAILRGRSYTAAGPLTYGLLRGFRHPERRLMPTQRPGHASAYTGFRVAVDLP